MSSQHMPVMRFLDERSSYTKPVFLSNYMALAFFLRVERSCNRATAKSQAFETVANVAVKLRILSYRSVAH